MRRQTGWAIAYAETPIEVARRADAVTINVAANGETKHLVNAEFLARHEAGRLPHQHFARVGGGRGGAGRGGARRSGLRAGLDVYEGEPARCHGGHLRPRWSSCRASTAPTTSAPPPTRRRWRSRTRPSISCSSSCDAGMVPNCVNRLARSSATHVLSVRHHNRPGVLAHVFEVLSDGAINVEEVENIIYHGARPHWRGSISTDARHRSSSRRSAAAIRTSSRST